MASMHTKAAHNDHATMSFGDHLEELRKRVMLAAIVPLPLAAVMFVFSNTLIEVLLLPLFRVLDAAGLPRQVQTLSPPEMVMTQLKLSMIAAFVLSAPWILWQAWKFISPGLYHHERRFVHFLIPGSGVLTLAGVALMYFVMLPLMLRVLVLLGTTLHMSSDAPAIDPRAQAIIAKDVTATIVLKAPESPRPGQAWIAWPEMKLFVAVEGPNQTVEALEIPKPQPPLISQMYRLGDYVGFVLLLFMGIVLAFQMPLVVVLLGWIGLVSADWLRRQRRYALFICAVVAIIITPPDVFSMIIMLGPMYGLYELGILLLVMAPASAVAEGRVFSPSRMSKSRPSRTHGFNRKNGADNPMSQPSQSARSVQRESSHSGHSATPHSGQRPSDAEGSGP